MDTQLGAIDFLPTACLNSSVGIASPRLPDIKEREKNACEKWVGAWGEAGWGLASSQAPIRFSHAVVFVFPTIWEPGTS